MIAGVVLAGGTASRMGGGDKCLRPLGDTTILAVLLARLSPQVAVLALSANGDAGRFAKFGLPVLPDAEVDQGPLAGVLAGLAFAAVHGCSAVLSVPGDTPFVPVDLAEALRPGPTYAAYAARAHPLVALWPVSLAPFLQAILRSGEHRAMEAARLLKLREVAFEAPMDPFININTPEDLALANRRLG